MNERIKQLAEQADDYADTYCDTIALSYSNWNTVRDAKFVELIVRECINSIQAEKDTGLYNAQQMAGMTASNAVIQEHFGVEK